MQIEQHNNCQNYIIDFQMQGQMMAFDSVQNFIENGFSWAKCQQIHPYSCDKFCATYFLRTWLASYKTYGAVYIVQMLFKLRAIAKNPMKQIPKIIISYLKSTSLTAVEMMIMRRILCILAKHYRNGQNNLLIANFLSEIYILIESHSRQIEIALYQLNNSSLILYKMAQRRGWIRGLPMGQCILFASAIMVISYHFFNNMQAFKKNYIRTIFEALIGQK